MVYQFGEYQKEKAFCMHRLNVNQNNSHFKPNASPNSNSEIALTVRTVPAVDRRNAAR